MPILVDINVLLRRTQSWHPQSFLADAALSSLLARGESLVVIPQVLYEFWVVVTRPVANNGLAMSAAVAAENVRELTELFTVLRDERSVYDLWLKLVTRYQVIGKNAHDARLAAAMIRHGVNRILTFNTRDFARYTEIEARRCNVFDGIEFSGCA